MISSETKDNIPSVPEFVNGNWNYWYDDFNRLLGSSTNGSILNFDYGRFGNRWHQFQNDNCFAGQCFSFTGNNNRMDGYFYDASGNLLNDGTHSYYYDAESRIIQVDGPTLGACSTATACYVYNASGDRVRKTTGSTSVDYLYDLASHEITELSSAGAMNRGEVYAGSRHVATYELGTTYLNFSDWLGTERLRTLATGVTCETITSLPYGDGQNTSGSCADSSPMHFTGKQRDAESGLDNFGARYDSSTFGRFMTPDWSASPEPVPYAKMDHPQSLDLYTYVGNNPASITDGDGHCWKWAERICNGFNFGYFVKDKDLEAALQNDADSFRKELHDTKVSKDGQSADDYLKGKSNKEVSDYYWKWRTTLLFAQAANGGVTPFMTQWGWNNTESYIRARNELESGPEDTTHETLNGKVPTREEALKMIKENGGTVIRDEAGHAPGGVSTHTEPHINYKTSSGKWQTVIVQK